MRTWVSFGPGLLLSCFLTYVAGCAGMVARSGIENVYSIPPNLTRLELHERFGTPDTSVTGKTGRPMEVFSIRRKLTDFKTEDEVALLITPLGIFYPLFFADTLIKSQVNKVDVAFVYGPDDRAIYYYATNIDPATQFFRAIINLAHPIQDTDAFEKCERLSACMTNYIAELRLRALETNYELDAESESRLQGQVEISQELENRKITREYAIEQLSKLQLSR